MGYMIKGGVWKNSEDEILKAAVMKYGLNQWSRISSLLVRKSAKQCKARWYEWLDPNIKKTEWTREEEEKLLHLAKIFPCQWRTIAPIVGRTPAQCVEHYEKLLDQAQGKEEPDENDPRKLKPGEIDPNPETRAARPDPIDMDEDEKEMLAEARVRLANTKGKKAKRKAREKMIEEARRLAAIQKKRELRAAGIEITTKKKVRGMDYNEEIPFERRPLEMGYSTGAEEDPKPNLHLANISLQTLEGKRRDEEEESKRKLDEKRIKKLKDRDYPTAVENINKLTNAFVNTKTKLVLPTPQLHDKELEEMGKVNSMQQAEAGSEESNATRFLVGNYTQRQTTPTPMRTPKVEDSVMREARNNIALLQTQTPLMGGENTSLSNADFSSVLPRTTQAHTPNLISNAFVTPKPRTGTIQTPFPKSRGDSVKDTPRHDVLGINAEEFMDQNWEVTSQSGMSVSNMSVQASQIRQQIKSSLLSLPKPKNDYQIEMPDIETLEPEVKKKRKLDAEDQEALERKMEEERQERMRKLISQAVRKNLPRPYKTSRNLVNSYLLNVPEEAEQRKEAEMLLSEEMLKMIARDASLYPFKGSVVEEVPDYEMFNQNELEEADRLLREEALAIKKTLRHGELSKEALQSTWQEGLKNLIFDEDSELFMDGKNFPKEEKIVFTTNDFQIKKARLDQEAKKIESLQKKVGVLLGGYPKRAKQIQHNLAKNLQDLDQYLIEQEVFKQLYSQEQRAISVRMDEVKKFYDELTRKEAELQKKHDKLLREREEALKEAPVVSFI